MLVNTAFYWSLGKIFNEIFNGFSSRSLSGAGTSRTRPLHGCGSKSDFLSLRNESSGYDTTVSQVPTELGNVVCLRQRHRQFGEPQDTDKSRGGAKGQRLERDGTPARHQSCLGAGLSECDWRIVSGWTMPPKPSANSEKNSRRNGVNFEKPADAIR
jgi:hypothetical protein